MKQNDQFFFNHPVHLQIQCKMLLFHRRHEHKHFSLDWFQGFSLLILSPKVNLRYRVQINFLLLRSIACPMLTFDKNVMVNRPNGQKLRTRRNIFLQSTLGSSSRCSSLVMGTAMWKSQKQGDDEDVTEYDEAYDEDYDQG